ncbi:glycoside hydrolase family 17 protein [Ancylobacter lacus]|uniref:glycoside hydrolase family 17 protein n=1 Tax=Ancylobacter lacus TaxID=2579970 RepID=UPI001BCA70EF|nr:beta-1,6-glucan synthase [Ancylobacter lacus]MBS7539923.1 beta-1,6-glucan synthase [Ancylobacter lacus]
MRLPFVLAAVVSAAILAAWAWLGAPVPAPPSPLASGEKLPCVSYAPFRPGQSPFMAGLVIPPEQIDDDFARLAKITHCVRTYSTEMGLDAAPALARKHGLTMLQGIWLGREKDKNQVEITNGIKAAQQNPDVVKGLIVGNEVLLRGELSATDLAQTIRAVKQSAGVPVTYADVWEFWERNRDLANSVDFVTVHILPFWEDLPVSADKAVAHIGEIRDHVGKVFAGHDILIGETGWPSAGRMREGAEPSPSNQAKVIQELLALAKEKNYRVNVIEAFDQPWKRALEGTVGGHWGFLDAYSRDFKFGWGEAVSDHPGWLWQGLGGVAFALAIFAAGLKGAARRGAELSAGRWLGIAAVALASGIAIGWAIAAVPVESRDAGGWVRAVVMIALGLVAPPLTAYALAAGTRQVGFATVLEPETRRAATGLEKLVGVVLVLAAVLAVQIAFGLVFDPRYRDFQFAGLTPILTALAAYALLAAPRPAAGERHAEAIAAGVFLLSGLFIILNERLSNWQALWTGALLVLFALSFWRLATAGRTR